MLFRPTLVLRVLLTIGLLAVFAIPVPAQDKPRRERGARPDRKPAPQVGETAPTFKLKTVDGKAEVDVAKFHDKQPVVLIFGSYT